MKKKAALIITHGKFGIELLKSVEMIMGEQEDAAALGLCLGDDVEALRAEAERIISENEKNDKETVVFVDLLGGSPSNVGLYMLRSHNVRLVTGVNIVMLIEFFSSREFEEYDALVEKVVESATDGIKKFDKIG